MGEGGEMTQTMYAHINKIKIKKNKCFLNSKKKNLSEQNTFNDDH
jgi:hypothetical protein